ncbi:MAG: hypothetical protein GX801_02205 [Fibrobacter sp.]|nr:hypothetical protein [Fibrobacter sp.]
MKKFLRYLLIALSIYALMGCATFRKISVGRTLQKCKFELEELNLNNISFNEMPWQEFAPVIPALIISPLGAVSTAMSIMWKSLQNGDISLNADLNTKMQIINPNSSYDSLWIKELRGEIFQDSILIGSFSLPSSPTVLPKDTSYHWVNAKITVDKNLIPLIEKDKATFHLDLAVSTSPDGEIIRFSERTEIKLNLPDKPEFVEDYGPKIWENILSTLRDYLNF